MLRLRSFREQWVQEGTALGGGGGQCNCLLSWRSWAQVMRGQRRPAQTSEGPGAVLRSPYQLFHHPPSASAVGRVTIIRQTATAMTRAAEVRAMLDWSRAWLAVT